MPRLRGVMILAFFLVLHDGTIELVRQEIDGGVHVAVRRVRMNRIAAHVQRRFRLVSQLLHRQYTVHIDDLFEMPRDSLHFLLDISSQCGSDLDMMTGEAKLHVHLLNGYID